MRAIDERIEGSFLSSFFSEFLKNSAHFPLTNLFLEALTEDPKEYFLEPDPYTLLGCALIQSFVLTKLKNKNPWWSFIGNFTGVAVYAAVEASLEGAKFFQQSQHHAYFYFSVFIALFQLLKRKSAGNLESLCEIFENVTRTLIPLVMYILFEAKGQSFSKFLPEFFKDPAHVFLALVVGLLGFLIGVSEAQNSRSRQLLKELAVKLKNYSSWSLGKQVLNEAVADERVFQIKRVNRSIVFMDIRGFTKWSEKESPEDVVLMLNNYYKKAEKVLAPFKILKMKYTADEIMIVFENMDDAATAALQLRESLNELLAEVNLTVGGGVHCGAVVEGLIGSHDHKIFDVMGDTVNTAKRLCENAKGNEILISSDFVELSEGKAFATEGREEVLKGKEKTHKVFPLVKYFAN